MSADPFWAAIDAQIRLVRRARSAGDVIAACPPVDGLSVGHGFFAGGGGDDSILANLPADWTEVGVRASYHWCMRAPDGSELTYVEGDLYVGNTMPAR